MNDNSEEMGADDLTQCASDNSQMTATRDILTGEQKIDDLLKSCWKLLQYNKSNFCPQDGILMRCEKILGLHYTQLVVPVNHRQQVSKYSYILAIHQFPRHDMGILPSSGLNTRQLAKYSNFRSIKGYVSETVQDRR